MIPPAHLAKAAGHKSEKSAVTSLDAAQWQQAISNATAVTPTPAKPPTKNIALPVQKPAANQPAAIELPVAVKKAAPAGMSGEALPHKKSEPPQTTLATASLPAPPVAPPPATPDIKPASGQNAKPDDHAIAIDAPIIDAPITATANAATAAAAPATAPSAPPQPANPQPGAPQNIHAAEKPVLAHEQSPAIINAAPPPATAEAAPAAQPAEFPAEKPAINANNAINATPPTALTATAPPVNAQAAIQAIASPAPISAAPITANAAGLAAAITAMHQSGQSTATMRLDPPGLGSLTIHLGVGQNDAVNILFVTAVPQTSQIIANHLNDLRQAMENSGLSLGNTSVGSGNTGGGNGGANPQSQPQPILEATPTAAQPANPSGIRAYA